MHLKILVDLVAKWNQILTPVCIVHKCTWRFVLGGADGGVVCFVSE